MQPATEIDLQLCYPSPKARQIDDAAVKSLAVSIADCGLLTPITARKVQKFRAGQMADAFEVIVGMHRVKAFRKLGRETIPAIVLEADDLHAELMMIDENLCRNNLTAAERAAAQARRKAIYQIFHPETKKGGNQSGPVGQFGQTEAPRFDEAAAEATGQSERSVRRDVTRGEALGEDTLAKVARTSLDKGEELDALAKLPPDQRQILIDRAAAGKKVSAKQAQKKHRRNEREADLGRKLKALPEKYFGIAIEDFEWDHKPWSRETGMDRHPANHYPTAADAHTPEEIVARTAERFKCLADDCVLYMWTTIPHEAVAHRVLELRGFKYVSQRIWSKLRDGNGRGLGYWVTGEHEILLIGVRGNVVPPATAHFRSLFEAPVGEHSAKPDQQYEHAEYHFPNIPKIELNARRVRPGWERWGNEALEPPRHDPESHKPRSATRVDVVPIADEFPALPDCLKRDADNAVPFGGAHEPLA